MDFDIGNIMKWARRASKGKEEYGIVENGHWFPQSVKRNNLGQESFLLGSHNAQMDDSTDLSSIKGGWLPPIARPGKILCIGRNYAAHSIEQGMEPESKPLIFSKYTTSMRGHGHAIPFPSHSQYFDYEVELAVVIGKKASRLDSTDQSLDHVFGISVANDLTARDVQKSEKQWTRGKGFDNSLPIGPTLTTIDEITDISNLDIWLKVNGEPRQKSNTSHMIFSIPYLIHYISQVITLEQGDIILTGTPEGVGYYMEPVSTLQSGDVVTSGITSLDDLEFSIQ